MRSSTAGAASECSSKLSESSQEHPYPQARCCLPVPGNFGNMKTSGMREEGASA